jgi:hypothetical protein
VARLKDSRLRPIGVPGPELRLRPLNEALAGFFFRPEEDSMTDPILPPKGPDAPFPAILLAIIAGSALLLSALGLFRLPSPPTDAQIAAAQAYLDGVCVACPVYEIVEETQWSPGLKP